MLFNPTLLSFLALVLGAPLPQGGGSGLGGLAKSARLAAGEVAASSSAVDSNVAKIAAAIDRAATSAKQPLKPVTLKPASSGTGAETGASGSNVAIRSDSSWAQLDRELDNAERFVNRLSPAQEKALKQKLRDPLNYANSKDFMEDFKKLERHMKTIPIGVRERGMNFDLLLNFGAN